MIVLQCISLISVPVLIEYKNLRKRKGVRYEFQLHKEYDYRVSICIDK